MFIKIMWRNLSLLLGVTLLLSCASIEPETSLESRAVNLDQRLICPVCPSETIDQSQTELALQMRKVVRGKLQDGYTDKQVEEYFIDRYGERVLASPSSDGLGLMVWVFTPFSVIFGLIVFFLVLREMRRNSLSTQIQGAPDTEVSDPEHLD
jgi:cytochrome c-type biogenesis protein CcmH